MTTKTSIISFLSQNKSKLQQKFDLTKIGLFGSYALGIEDNSSDIDLIIEFKPNTRNLSQKKYALKVLIEQQFNKEVDLCREKYIKPYFKQHILEQAIYV